MKRVWEVGRSRSTCEADEQGRRGDRGAGGGKGIDQGEHGQQNASRTQCRARRAQCAGPCAAGGSTRQGGTVHSAVAPDVDVDRLRDAYRAINPNAAPGVDKVTWAAYGQDLEDNLRGLHQRLHAGRYRARPTRRVYIPKADGRLRPLGIAALEDKILQRAVVEVLNAIYEADFRGFSYGFRPGRGPHDALDALTVGLEPVSYTHLRAHETDSYLVCRLLLEKKKNTKHIIS